MPEEGAHGKSPKCLGGNLGDFGEFCKGLKWLTYTPEEEIRQKFICVLVNEYGYSLNQMAQELSLTNSSRGTGRARA
ncbi:type I restriction enzyme HsdR N-terminal domain-containing protein, partial [Neisseria polysaccharea]